ncbi:MAG: hypothetical protein ISR65_02265 [Bacteriovoracaceae bacterium]|nr:hypothetical protein [Bacteriovoracaceae bacterium]
MVFKGGLIEAAKLLAGLETKNRERVIELIAKQDPEIAKKLQQSMVTIEDLQYLTVSMLQELLKKVQLNDLGAALRIGSPELVDSIISRVSRSIKEEILETLKGPPISVDKVLESVDKIMAIVQQGVERGEFVIDKDAAQKLV